MRKVARELDLDPKEFISRLDIKKAYEQKGVDTLLVLDMVRLAQHGTYDYAILVAGDRDLEQAIRTAQDLDALYSSPPPREPKSQRRLAESLMRYCGLLNQS